MEKLNREQILSLPNGLTITRILVIPLILILLFYPGRVFQLLAALLFVAAAVTDTLDGYLARRRGVVTTLGKFLDPLADKLLIVTALIALIPARDIPAWMVIVIVGREIAITGLRGIAVSQGIIISASTLGKYKTVFESASISFLILNGSYFAINFRPIGMALLWIALVIAVISGVDYFRKYLKSIIV
ncbi:MAG: CDP-diacylglycerol--glycerol-3-phosphate 3-phosphatidyltransferase [Deltaproteobacteria bacterium RBG_19FT_COMBO_46_12]|nr:MAG: CDP-diacylglycerol--glycerol-3-phosphate 3-phosphatidyltransferase [Deltaproteobacteria bacterium RBG_19FT_COMBO_46_12]